MSNETEQADADQLIAALRGFDPNFYIIGNIKAGTFIQVLRRLQDEVQELRDAAEDEDGQRARDKCIGAYGYDLSRLG